MNATNPTVSVIVPLYNAAQFIAAAIDSILAQTVPPAEIVVVDDGSTDGSAAVVARYPQVRLLRKSHTGLADSLNQGVAAATGAFLAFLDADDLWVRDKQARQRAAFAADPALELVFGHVRQFYWHKHPVSGLETRTEVLQLYAGFAKSGLLVRCSAFDRVGLFATATVIQEFFDWYTHAVDLHLQMKLIPDIVYERRIHDANMSIRNAAALRASHFYTLKTALDRRRAGQASNS